MQTTYLRSIKIIKYENVKPLYQYNATFDIYNKNNKFDEAAKRNKSAVSSEFGIQIL